MRRKRCGRGGRRFTGPLRADERAPCVLAAAERGVCSARGGGVAVAEHPPAGRGVPGSGAGASAVVWAWHYLLGMAIGHSVLAGTWVVGARHWRGIHVGVGATGICRCGGGGDVADILDSRGGGVRVWRADVWTDRGITDRRVVRGVVRVCLLCAKDVYRGDGRACADRRGVGHRHRAASVIADRGVTGNNRNSALSHRADDPGCFGVAVPGGCSRALAAPARRRRDPRAGAGGVGLDNTGFAAAIGVAEFLGQYCWLP